VNQGKITQNQVVTVSTSTISVKNKAQLDIYLKKLEKQKLKYKNVEDYIKQLEKTSAQLSKLSTKYEKNSQVKAMLDYLDQ
jgi:predicted type IV restriction endonuclease